MTNKMQIVAVNYQTFLTADSWRCLIDSDSESEVLDENCLSLRLRRETCLIDGERRRGDSDGARRQIRKLISLNRR